MFNITQEQTTLFVKEMNSVFSNLSNRVIPESMPNDIRFYLDYSNLNFREAMCYRDRYIEQVGFVRITKNWVRPLSKWIGKRKCLEIMSGSGALTYALKEEGVLIKATDDFSWNKPFKPWIQVENIDCIAAIEKYGREVDFIMCSWPYMDDTAYRALLKMREVNPKCRMIYIGEGNCGCTADENFFEAIYIDNVKGFEEAVKKFTQWEGMHDYPLLVK